jgi:hypothetical protein
LLSTIDSNLNLTIVPLDRSIIERSMELVAVGEMQEGELRPKRIFNLPR